MNEHNENLDKLIEIDNISNILDAGSGKTSLTYLLNKYPNANIDAIVYPGDNRKINSIKENVIGKYNLIELDICKTEIKKTYDLVLAHLLIGEASKFENNFKDLVQKLLNIDSKYFIIYDFQEDTDIDFEYLKQALKENDFEILDSMKSAKKEAQEFGDFVGKTYVGYLVKRSDVVDISYAYINEYITREELIHKLKNINKCLYTKEQQEDIKELIEKILEKYDYPDVEELLVNNQTYLYMAQMMSAKDLLLMITRYIKATRVPGIDQSFFDELVEIGIKHNKKEALWRLAFNYENQNKDFSKIVDYYIETRDHWYFGELICAVRDDVNVNETINKIKSTNDKEFIKNIIEYDKQTHIFSKKDADRLGESLKK